MSIADRAQPAGLDQPLVLLIETDSRLTSFLDRALAAAGYRVERTTDARQALARFEELAPDIVVLDLVLPGRDGLDVVRRLRARSGLPIVMLAADNGVDDRVAGLDAGADDVLPKPVAPAELLARVRALLRGRALATARAVESTRRGVLSYADVHLDLDAREAWRGGRRLELRNKGFELLACFMRHPRRVLSRHELLEEVWDYEFLGNSNVIDVTVSHLRQALEAGGEPRLIHTVRSLGYILNART